MRRAKQKNEDKTGGAREKNRKRQGTELAIIHPGEKQGDGRADRRAENLFFELEQITGRARHADSEQNQEAKRRQRQRGDQKRPVKTRIDGKPTAHEEELAIKNLNSEIFMAARHNISKSGE